LAGQVVEQVTWSPLKREQDYSYPSVGEVIPVRKLSEHQLHFKCSERSCHFNNINPVAEAFEKTHSHVVRDIKKLIKQCGEEFAKSNFGLTFENKKICNTKRNTGFYQVDGGIGAY
jgi:hypothetical protein